MLYQNLFSRDLFSELERLQRDLDRSFGRSVSIRGTGQGYPAMNVATTPKSVEIDAFVPGLSPESIDLQIEKGVLTLSGERVGEPAAEGVTVHINERFSGRFHRLVSLPEDVDATSAQARYRDGLLHISVARREATQPRRITIQ